MRCFCGSETVKDNLLCARHTMQIPEELRGLISRDKTGRWGLDQGIALGGIIAVLRTDIGTRRAQSAINRAKTLGNSTLNAFMMSARAHKRGRRGVYTVYTEASKKQLNRATFATPARCQAFLITLPCKTRLSIELNGELVYEGEKTERGMNFLTTEQRAKLGMIEGYVVVNETEDERWTTRSKTVARAARLGGYSVRLCQPGVGLIEVGDE